MAVKIVNLAKKLYSPVELRVSDGVCTQVVKLVCFLTLSLPNVAKGKFLPNFQISNSFSKILRNKWHYVKVQAESFHLNDHIIRFRPQTQKLESPYITSSNTLAVKGLTQIFISFSLPYT